jgi:large subunit ribosomal protein L35
MFLFPPSIAFPAPFRYRRTLHNERLSTIAWPEGLPRRFETVEIERTKMPKLKTKSGVKKRFTLTASGLLKHGVAGKRHRLTHHTAKYIRQNRGTKLLSKADTATVKAWAPYGLQ